MTGFLFDGRHSSAFSLCVIKKEIPLTPAIENRLQDISGIDGAWDYGVSYGPRLIEMDCVVVADTKAELNQRIHSLSAWLNPRKGVKSLIFDDDPTKQYFARLGNQVPLQTTGCMGTFTIQMVSPDPFLYDITQTHLSFTTFPCTVTHFGTHTARPILTITHGGGAASIEHIHQDQETREFCFHEGAPGGIYVMDCKHFMLVIEGVGTFNHCAGPFFTLPTGSNTFLVTGAISQIDFSFFNTWI